VVDVSDNPFHHKSAPTQQFYQEALTLADAVVVNSDRMAQLVAPWSSRPAVVIEDAVLEQPAAPRFAPGTMLKLLWFGHQSNLRYLLAHLDALTAFSREKRCRMTLVSAPNYGAESIVRELQTRFSPFLEARFVPWSLDATRKALDACDLVLIPSNADDPNKAG